MTQTVDQSSTFDELGKGLCVIKGHQRHGRWCGKACSSQSNLITASARLGLSLDTTLLTTEPKFTVGATIATNQKNSSKCSL